MRAKFIYEKFTDESDPIHDMGIGIFYPRTFKNTLELHKWIIRCLPAILGEECIPDDIIRDKKWYINEKYDGKIDIFSEKYLRIESLKDFSHNYNPQLLHKMLMRRGYRVGYSWPIKKNLFEKFTDESDPIRDMNIGIYDKIVQWLNKMDIKNYTINDDLTIDVIGSVKFYKLEDLQNNKIYEFPKHIQFRKIIKGCFLIPNLELITLKGCPYEIFGGEEGDGSFWHGDFVCSNNNLTSLEFAPKKITGSFQCNNNSKIFTKNDVIEVCQVGSDLFL